MLLRFLACWLTGLCLLACNGFDGSRSSENLDAVDTVGPDELALSFVDAPVDVSDSGAQYISDMAYGNLDRQTFDMLLYPNSVEPTPLVLYFHGGGFTAGDKSIAFTGGTTQDINHYLTNGIAFATANYRLLQDVDTEGVIKPLSDALRVLQFIRLHAEQLNIDPERIVLQGNSAGAGAALWVGLNDDMAISDSSDLIAQQSSRVTAIAVTETQATYDIVRWETDVFLEYNITLELALVLGLESRLFSFYGIDALEELNDPDIELYRDRVDMLDLITPDDPPIWVSNERQPLSPPVTVDILFHHANHALMLKQQADAIGLPSVFYMPVLDINDPSGETLAEFVTRQLLE